MQKKRKNEEVDKTEKEESREKTVSLRKCIYEPERSLATPKGSQPAKARYRSASVPIHANFEHHHQQHEANLSNFVERLANMWRTIPKY